MLEFSKTEGMALQSELFVVEYLVARRTSSGGHDDKTNSVQNEM